MKKILFAIACVMTLALGSCIPSNNGFGYSTTFSRVVTIDTAKTPVQLVADYTGEVFKTFTNPQYVEQLAEDGMRRAEVMMRLDVDEDYTQTLTLLTARKIAIQAVSSTAPTEPLRPLAGWQPYPLGGTGYTPAVWVSNGYLNILPVIPALSAGKYYLMPDTAMSDTLHFSLKASYEPSKAQMYYENIQCYDLRTLRDTANAEEGLRGKMTAMLDAMDKLRQDSMRIVVTSLIDVHYYEKDTLMEQSAMTNFFKYDF